MAIVGAHMLLYTTEAEKLRAMLRDVFGFTHVDAGDGWLIFALPPSELGVPSRRGADLGVGRSASALVHVRRHPRDHQDASRQGCRGQGRA